MRVERQVLFWLAAGLGLIAMIGLLRDILLPFVAGMTIAYFLNPLTERLTALGLGRIGASAVVVLAVGVLLIGLAVLLVPLLISQAQQLALTLPAETERVRALVEDWARVRLGSHFAQFQSGLDSALNGLAQNWAGLIGFAARSLWDRSLAVFNFVSLLLVTPLVVFYMLVDWNPMLEKLDGWLPRDHAPTIRRLASDINDAVAAFIRGQGTVCLILGSFYATALSFANIRYGLLVGIASGLLAFVPFVGWAVGMIVASMLALVQAWPDLVPLMMVVCIYLTGMAIDSAILSPAIVGSKIGLHPVWLIFALFVFTYLFGVVGALVAVPVAAAIAVLVRFSLDAYLASSVYLGREAPIAKLSNSSSDAGS